jgi:hypothetical protein
VTDSSRQPATFNWHPAYAGQSVDNVRRELIHEIGRDQRQYALALEGAEASEHDSLNSIVELERRWGTYDFDWAETDPEILADKVIAFELERDQRQEMIGFAEWRAEQQDTGEEPAPEFAWKTAPVLVGAAIMIVIIVIILAVVL